MTSPLISIAIPTYNRVGYLSEALNSAQCQNYPNLEILVQWFINTLTYFFLCREAGCDLPPKN